VLLVAARLETAGSAIHLREERGEPISNRVQEDRVIARAQGWAKQVGLSPTAVETIFRAIMGAGKERYAAQDGPPVRPAGLRGGDSQGARRPRRRKAHSRRSRIPVPRP
jgi:chorismate mutase